MAMTHSIFVFLVMTLSETQGSMQDAKSAQISSTGRVFDAKPHSFSSRTMRDAREKEGGISALLEVDGSMRMDENSWTSPGAFDRYKQMYHRTYPIGSEEHDMREALFNQRVAEMVAHNAKGESWRLGVNQFTDWTQNERKRLLGYKRSAARSEEVVSASLLDEGSSVNTTSHHKTCLKRSSTCGKSAHCCSGLACGTSGKCKACTHYSKRQAVDWSSKIPGMTANIMDQGSCGSCWAIAAAGAIEAQLAQRDSKNNIRVSPEELLQCSPNPRHCGGDGGCQGSTPELAFNWAQGNKLSKLSDRSYSARDLVGTSKKRVCPSTGSDDDAASYLDSESDDDDDSEDSKAKPQITIGGFVHLPLNKASSVMQALVCVGPVVVAAAASSWFGYSGGVLTCGKDSSSLTVDHAILMVGFGKSGKDHYWKIRNSWGTDFGEDGFIRLRRHPNKEPCGKDLDMQKGVGCQDDPKVGTVCGECGVLSDTAYPVGTKLISDSDSSGL
jgi:cathepsin L